MAGNPRHSSGAQMAKALQRYLYDRFKSIYDGPETKNKTRELNTITKAWCDITERRRILLGKPLPGCFHPDLDVNALRRLASLPRFRAMRAIDLPPAGSERG